MKQLGPNLYKGNFDDIVALRNLTLLAEDKKRDDERRLKAMLPSDRFLTIASETWRKPMRGTYPWTYQAEEYGLMEINRMYQKDFPDIDQISDFMIQMRSLYIVDLYQGQGIGRKIINRMKNIAEKSSCCFCLFVHPFGFTKGGDLPSGFRTFSELTHAALIEEWEIFYHSEFDAEATASFYKECGLTNICLYSEEDRGEKADGLNKWYFHFIYIPDSLDHDYRKRLDYRLNLEECEYCKPE
jgi:GNAT superfamily N-acetyltransferase